MQTPFKGIRSRTNTFLPSSKSFKSLPHQRRTLPIIHPLELSIHQHNPISPQPRKALSACIQWGLSATSSPVCSLDDPPTRTNIGTGIERGWGLKGGGYEYRLKVQRTGGYR